MFTDGNKQAWGSSEAKDRKAKERVLDDVLAAGSTVQWWLLSRVGEAKAQEVCR